MRSIKTSAVKAVLALSMLGGAFAVLASPREAQAGPYHYHRVYVGPRVVYAPHFPVPRYHAPSVHLHRTYHHDYFHWTPVDGWHSHGHFHVEPHFTPGHLHW
jgi:hypothetical protein